MEPNDGNSVSFERSGDFGSLRVIPKRDSRFTWIQNLPSLFFSHSSTTLSMSTPLDAFDLLIVGFGPASLALSIALAEPTNSKKEFSSIGKLSESLRSHSASSIPTSNSNQRIRTAVIELSPSFSWHQGMLLEGSRMQIS